MPETVALVTPLLPVGLDLQASHHHGHVRQHGDQQQALDALALPRPMHTEAQSKQGALDITEAFFNLHALPVDSDQLVCQH
ncbi:hypothetical protein R5M92_03855 [Halomonas sp. Bachu 37]